jgi:hypothetical protein
MGARTSAEGKSTGGKFRGHTLRLNPKAHRQLKLLALNLDTHAHKLLIEAVNDLFVKHGKKPLA